jgi:hypothetical protein
MITLVKKNFLITTALVGHDRFRITARLKRATKSHSGANRFLKFLIPGSQFHFGSIQPSRPRFQNFSRGMIARRPQASKAKFDAAEDGLLFDAVRRLGTANWRRIARLLPGRNARQCRERWNNYLSPELVNGEWSLAEDEILWNKYAELGPHWVAIAKLFPGRSKNSVRNRFLHLQRQRNRANPKRSEREQPKPEEDPFRFMDAAHPDHQFVWEASGLDE